MSGFGPLEAEWEWVVAKARPPSMLLLGRGSVTCGAFSLSRANPRLHIDVYAIISLLEPDQTC